MVRGNMLRLAVALSGVAMVINGCACDQQPPVTCADAVVTFEQPVAGATVDAPFDVSIVARTADGAAFDFEAASLKIGSATFTGEVSGNRATFTGVTSASGEQEISAAIAQGSCSQTGKQTVTVRSTTCATPTVTSVSFPQDIDANGTLNSGELSGAIQVRVAATCVSGVQVRIKRGNTEVGALTSFTNNAAMVTLNDPNPADDQYEFVAELVRDGQVVGMAGASAVGRIRVARSGPAVAVTTSGTFGPADDASSTMSGFQLDVMGTAPDGVLCELKVDDQTQPGISPVSGELSARFTLPQSTGTHTVTLTCIDASGNVGTASGMFSLNFTPPSLTVISPMNSDGGAVGVVTESPLQITLATSADDGSIATVARDGLVVGTGLVSNGMASLEAPFGGDGTYELLVSVEDTNGNRSSVTLTVSVDLTGCGLVFTRPATGSALLTPAQLNGGTYSFQTRSDAVCAGQTVTLFRSDIAADGGVGAEQQVGSVVVNAAGVADFAPLTMTNGDARYRGVVANPNDAGVSSAVVRVTVDLDGPAITNPIVPTGQPAALLTAAQDTAAGIPGVQRTLAFSARVPMGGRVDVCITQANDGMGPLTPGGECGANWYLLRQAITSPSSGFTFPEGEYDIKIIVANSGLTPAPASAPVHVIVDGTRPCLRAITRALPQDTTPTDSRLNISELAGQAPRLQFSLGCGDMSAAALSTTNGVVIRDVVNGSPGAVRPSNTTFMNDVATVTLTGAYATEQDLNLFVELTDVIGNKNLYLTTNDPSSFVFRVDPVAPVCSIDSPSQTTLGIAQVPGGNLNVQVGTASDVGMNGVSLTFTGQAARVVTPNLNTASSIYALSGDAAYTIGAVCTDQSGNATTAAARNVRVDLVAPTCAITQPVPNDNRAEKNIVTTVAVTGAPAGAAVTVTSTVAGITNNLLSVNSAGTLAEATVTYPNGAQTITATVADDVGNTCTSAGVTFTVNSTSCNLDFDATGPIITNSQGSWLNRAGASLPEQGPTPPNATVAIKAVTSDCGAGKNAYLYPGGASTTPGGSPVVTGVGGVVTFPAQAFPEDSLYTVTIDNGAGQFTHRSFTVSLKAPSVAGGLTLRRSAQAMTAVPVAKDAALVFGAATGNRRVETATAADLVFGDLDATAADAQFQLAISGIDGANVGAFKARLEVFEGATLLSPAVTVDTAPFTPSLPMMKLAHRLDDTATSLVIRVTSPAGNTYTSTHSALVDVIAPAVPTVTRNLTSARAATVDVQWSAVFDDGTDTASGGLTGGAQAAGYDIRWTTSSVPANNAMVAEADYFGSSSKQETVEPWQSGNITKALTLPPLNTYFIAVRARDEVGNYSTFAAPTSVANPWTVVTLTVANAPTDFGQTVTAASNVTGSAENDILISAPSLNGVGAVYVFQGSAALTSQTTCAAGCTQLAPPDGIGTFFGSDVSTGGNVGDDAADATTTGMADIVIGQRGYSTTGRAFVFFGSTAGITRSIEIRGDVSNTIGWTASLIGDLDGDGLREVALPAHLYGSGRGRIYIFKGRSYAAWQAAFMSGQQFIPVTSANWVIEGEYLVAANPANSSNGLGLNRLGVATLPGVTGRTLSDGGVAPELVVSIPRANVSRVALYGAAQITASSSVAPLGAFDGGIQVLSQAPFASNSIVVGFGASLWGAGPVQRVDLADLYVGYPNESRVYRYSNWGTSGAASGAATENIQGIGGFGANVTSGDLNGDGKPDLLVGEGGATNNGAWILYQRAGAFDSPVGGTSPQFNVSELRPVRNGGLSNQMPNRFVALGDFGAGVTVIAADATTGSVRLWK